MIVDANLLLYAVDSQSRQHDRAAAWLGEVMNGAERMGLPAQTLGTFLRISTHPRVFENPLTAAQASERIDDWLARANVWVPPTSENTLRILTELARRHHITGNLVPDAQLAALAIEHGVEVASADTDFARFDEVRWVNPLR